MNNEKNFKSNLYNDVVLYELKESVSQRDIHDNSIRMESIMKFPMTCAYCYYLCRDNDHLMNHTCMEGIPADAQELKRRFETWAPEYPIRKKRKPSADKPQN